MNCGCILKNPERRNTVLFRMEKNLRIDSDEFKDVTWENSPKCIKCCPRMIDQLNYHFDTTPKEELDKEFEELEPWSHVGPTVDEYPGKHQLRRGENKYICVCDGSNHIRKTGTSRSGDNSGQGGGICGRSGEQTREKIISYFCNYEDCFDKRI